MIFRRLGKGFIYQAFLRAPIHLEAPNLETFLFVCIKCEFGGSLTHIITHEIPGNRIVYIWACHPL
jgi:hypothetical protein